MAEVVVCKVCGLGPRANSRGIAGADTLAGSLLGTGQVVENRHSSDCAHHLCPGYDAMAEEYCPERFREGLEVPAGLSRADARAYIARAERKIKESHVLTRDASTGLTYYAIR